MVEWVTIEALTIYVIVVLSFAFSLLAVYFAYRLSRITGRFGAWTLLIAGLALTAFEDFAYFGSVVFSSYASVVKAVEGYTWVSFLLVVLILLAIPALFFGAMYRLHGLFKTQSVRPIEAHSE